MPKIIEIVGIDNKGSYANVHVILDDGTEAQVWVGGNVEVFFDKEKIKAFVKKN